MPGLSALRDAWVRLAALITVLLPVYFLAIALLTRAGWLDWRGGLMVMTLQAGPLLCLVALAGGITGLALALLARPRRGWRLALVAIGGALAALSFLAGPELAARNAPRLHDISTDLTDPPRFSPIVAAERALTSGSNGLDLASARIRHEDPRGLAAGQTEIEVQRAALPDIKPISVGAPKARALAAAQGAAQALGWQLDRVDQAGGTIEARDVDFWYGFVTDIAIRVTGSGAGAVVDVRASARTQRIDFGANAERIRAFARELRRQLSTD